MHKNYRIKSAVIRIALHIICISVLLICVIPLYLLFLNATRKSIDIISGVSFFPGNNLVENFKGLLEYCENMDYDLIRSFFNSCIISILSTSLCVYFSALTAYAFHAYEFKGKKILFGIVMLIIMIPGQLGMIGFYDLVVDLHIIDTFIPLTLPAIASASTVFFITQYLKANFSKDYIEAARVDGGNEFYIFNLITLPIVKPSLLTMGIMGIVSSWNNFMGPLLYLQSTENYTLPLIAYQVGIATDIDYGIQYLALALTIVPLMIIYFFFSKQIINGVAAGGVKE